MPAELPRMPSLRLDGRRALVTGASGGIGQAAAVALAEAGAEVLLTARRLAPLEETVEALLARGLRARALSLDVTDRAAVRALVSREGPFRILVNNAGTNIRQPFLEVTDEALDSLLDLNVRAAFTVAHAVARGMVEARQGGAIINIGSTNGHVAGADRSVYCATKFAIEGLTRAMAVELGRYGIRVNSICPTWIETPLTARVLSDADFRARAVASLPIGRVGTVEDVMGAVVFLASDAAGMITGAPLLVDGGLTAQ
jgi:NAD(P)-dependent dehydrogenase (short-subunit alcohol dehydrogenase family)